MKRVILLLSALCSLLAGEPNCRIESIRGTYLVSSVGWALMPQPGAPLPMTVPGVIMGVVSIGYDGTLSGTESVMVAGHLVDYEVTTGSVSINPDCTGTINMSIRPKGTKDHLNPVTERFVFLVDSQEIHSMAMNSPDATVGAMGLGTWRLIARTPDWASW
jgi:hypothetical protein